MLRSKWPNGLGPCRQSSSLTIPPPLIYPSLLLLKVSLSLVPVMPLAMGVPALEATAVDRPSAMVDASSKSCISGWLAVSSLSFSTQAAYHSLTSHLLARIEGRHTSIVLASWNSRLVSSLYVRALWHRSRISSLNSLRF